MPTDHVHRPTDHVHRFTFYPYGSHTTDGGRTVCDCGATSVHTPECDLRALGRAVQATPGDTLSRAELEGFARAYQSTAPCGCVPTPAQLDRLLGMLAE